MGARHRALEVQGQHPVPLFGRGVEEEGDAVAAGVVHEHVDDTLPQRRAHGVPVGDVQGKRLTADLGGHLLGADLVDVGHDDVEAVEDQAPAGGGADAGRTTSDDRDSHLWPHALR